MTDILNGDDFNEVPAKYFDVKTYIRVNNDAQPEVVRVEPMITVDQTFVPGLVRLYVDDQKEPTVMARVAAEMILNNTGCIPLEEMLNYKHKIKN